MVRAAPHVFSSTSHFQQDRISPFPSLFTLGSQTFKWWLLFFHCTSIPAMPGHEQLGRVLFVLYAGCFSILKTITWRPRFLNNHSCSRSSRSITSSPMGLLPIGLCTRSKLIWRGRSLHILKTIQRTRYLSNSLFAVFAMVRTHIRLRMHTALLQSSELLSVLQMVGWWWSWMMSRPNIAGCGNRWKIMCIEQLKRLLPYCTKMDMCAKRTLWSKEMGWTARVWATSCWFWLGWEREHG